MISKQKYQYLFFACVERFSSLLKTRFKKVEDKTKFYLFLSRLLMKFLLLFCQIAAIYAAKSSKKDSTQQPTKQIFKYGADLPLDMHNLIRNVSSSKNCSASSPINQIKYNYTKVHELKSADFCYHYSPRTCCSTENFNALRMK